MTATNWLHQLFVPPERTVGSGGPGPWRTLQAASATTTPRGDGAVSLAAWSGARTEWTPVAGYAQ
jgi:hypothetical protein